MNALIPRPIIVGVRPDFTPIYSENENAHAMSQYPCFNPATHPTPVMPPPQRAPVSDAILAILRDTHADHVETGELYLSPTRQVPCPAFDRRAALDHSARANRIVGALRDAGCHAEADRLRDRAAGLEQALLSGGV